MKPELVSRVGGIVCPGEEFPSGYHLFFCIQLDVHRVAGDLFAESLLSGDEQRRKKEAKAEGCEFFHHIKPPSQFFPRWNKSV
jgi:hypothetical protein